MKQPGRARRQLPAALIERFRAGISVGPIRERLDRQALGILTKRLKDGTVVPDEMSKAALKAAEILLSRCVPTVSSVEMTGKDGGPIESNVTFYMPQNGRGK